MSIHARDLDPATAKALGLEARRRKYGNKVVVEDGLRFDSAKEYRRWRALQLLERAGKIRNLRHHVRYPLVVNGETVSVYTADAVYEEPLDGGYWATVVEDTKADSKYVRDRDRSYGIRKKLLHALTGITIREV